MGWATRHIVELQAGRAVQFRPRGNSMLPLVKDGQLVTVEPLSGLPAVGSIVLCKVNGAEYLHLVKAVQGERVLIGNNKNKINGWTKSVYGLCVRVED